MHFTMENKNLNQRMKQTLMKKEKKEMYRMIAESKLWHRILEEKKVYRK